MYICYAFVTGIFSGLMTKSILILILCLIISFICYIKNKKLYILIIIFFLLGFIRVIVTDKENLIIKTFVGKKEIIGTIIAEPDNRIEYVNYIFKPKESNQYILLRANLHPNYNYLDQISIKCDIKEIENFNDKFNYIKYLQMKNIYGICYYPSIIHIGSSDKITIKKIIYILKEKFAKQINILWPEPKSSFIAGILYGSRSGLPQELTDNFNKTGVTHIIAISGYNITIVVVFTMSLFIRLGLYRKQAFWWTSIFVIVFIIFTGASASVVRAGMMGIFVLLAEYINRPSQIYNILVYALVIMLLINPLTLFYDSGFQLSYLATIGLVYLSPRITKKLSNFFNQTTLTESFSTTVSAIIFTAPLIIYQFERFSLVALIVNILILWLIPYIMLLSFLAVILSFVSVVLSLPLSLLVYFLIEYIIKIVSLFSSFNISSIDTSISINITIIIYILLCLYLYFTNDVRYINKQ